MISSELVVGQWVMVLLVKMVALGGQSLFKFQEAHLGVFVFVQAIDEEL